MQLEVNCVWDPKEAEDYNQREGKTVKQKQAILPSQYLPTPSCGILPITQHQQEKSFTLARVSEGEHNNVG